MTITLTDDPTQFPPVVVPAGGDPRTADGMQAPFQALANRTANLEASISTFATPAGTPAQNAGAKQIQHFPNVAALRGVAAANRSDGNVAVVDGGNGLWEYQLADTTADDGLYTLQPSDITSGAGRWVNTARVNVSTTATPVAGVPPVTDSTGRVPAALTRGGIVALDQQLAPATLTNPGSAFVNVVGAKCTLPGLQAGDVITIAAAFQVLALANDETEFQIAIVDGAGATTIVGGGLTLAAADLPAGSQHVRNLSAFFTVTASGAGTHTVTPQWRVVEATAGSSIANVMCMARALRP
jgi:hypothetical protein